MEPSIHFILSAEALYQEALQTVEEQLQNIETDGTPVSEGHRLLELAEIHLKMRRISQAEQEIVNAMTFLIEYYTAILQESNAISEALSRTLFYQEHRPMVIHILQTCIRAAGKLSGICRCASRKKEAKRFDKISRQLQEYLRKEEAYLSEPQLIPMKVVGTDFIGVQMIPA